MHVAQRRHFTTAEAKKLTQALAGAEVPYLQLNLVVNFDIRKLVVIFDIRESLPRRFELHVMYAILWFSRENAG